MKYWTAAWHYIPDLEKNESHLFERGEASVRVLLGLKAQAMIFMTWESVRSLIEVLRDTLHMYGPMEAEMKIWEIHSLQHWSSSKRELRWFDDFFYLIRAFRRAICVVMRVNEYRLNSSNFKREICCVENVKMNSSSSLLKMKNDSSRR